MISITPKAKQYIQIKLKASGNKYARLALDGGGCAGFTYKWEETNEGLRCRKIKYETVELDFDDEEYFKFLRFAHENNMSFNELVEESVKEAMKNNEENGTI